MNLTNLGNHVWSSARTDIGHCIRESTCGSVWNSIFVSVQLPVRERVQVSVWYSVYLSILQHRRAV